MQIQLNAATARWMAVRYKALAIVYELEAILAAKDALETGDFSGVSIEPGALLAIEITSLAGELPELLKQFLALSHDSEVIRFVEQKKEAFLGYCPPNTKPASCPAG